MLQTQTKFFRRVALALAMAFTMASLPIVPASAGMIATDQIITQSQAAEARAVVDSFMARDEVKQELQALGVDPAEAESRVGTLSDAEAVDLAQKIQDLPAGQGAIGAIVGAAVLIFVVLLITDLLGFTSVFGFTNKGSANPS
jgi:hypothetical protein